MEIEKNKKWEPLDEKKFNEIKKLFEEVFPKSEYQGLAGKISKYWTDKLTQTWENKSEKIKSEDKKLDPSDKLSKIKQETVLIAYADSVKKKGEKNLTTLNTFLKKYFPSIGGLHMLPACVIAEDRFNDGYFSQVVRNHTHERFGTDEQFVEMMGEYYSMADFVLNHVDIDNPRFQKYLNGDDVAGKCFYVFKESEYQDRLTKGGFDKIFRPRPFPLFTIFRRTPVDSSYANIGYEQKIEKINEFFEEEELEKLSETTVGILSIFDKIKNDQMLEDEDYKWVAGFDNPDSIFDVSETQETQHTPYIFKDYIKDMKDFLVAVGIESELAEKYTEVYKKYDEIVFGEKIRALTTFSHVQVDLNTATFEGLKMLADDFSWYLSMDLNMLRLDAANFAFKKWGTTCFGLPEAGNLMKILFLSMDCVSPRIVPNLEINDLFSNVLKQMSDKKTAPPMMYDFHLVNILPVVFNTGNTKILSKIFDMIAKYDVPKESIRFSLVESHDGKSVRGSLDILTSEERQGLSKIVEDNGGSVKYRSGPEGKEPYELCTSTRDCLIKLDDSSLEAERYLTFHTLAFALMGRNVKAIYFNDLLGLSNDYEKVKSTGELRDIKRSKSDFDMLEKILSNADSFEAKVASGMNSIISLLDSDPALHFRGNEASVSFPLNLAGTAGSESVVVVHNFYEDAHSLVVINIGAEIQDVIIDVPKFGLGDGKELYDNSNGKTIPLDKDNKLALKLKPFERFWLTKTKIEIIS